MDTDQQPQTVEPVVPSEPRFNFKIFSLITFIVVLFLVSIFAAYYMGTINSKTVNTTPDENIADNSDIEDFESKEEGKQLIKILPALDRFHTLYVAYDESEDSCEYGIVDISGFIYDSSYIAEYLDTNKIACQDDSFTGLTPMYIGWLGENSYAVESEAGIIKMIDISGYQLEEIDRFEYDSSKLRLIGISKSPNYFLFQDNENSQYKLFDINQNIVLDNISSESYSRGAFYDEVNDGFVFVDGKDNDEGSYFTFDFLSASDLNLRNVLSTVPIEIVPRGCNGDFLISDTVGQVKFMPGCIDTHDQHKDNEGNIVIEL